MGRNPRILPLTSASVTVNGHVHGPLSVVWGGMMWRDAYIGVPGLASSHLCVPFCHPNDTHVSAALAIYRVRPRDDRFRFERARNGLWVLMEEKP